MSAATFTPGPWEQHSLMVSEAGQRIGQRRDICHCGMGMRDDPYESEANARRIVQCVNSHDELLEALSNYVRVIATAGGGDKDLFMSAIREADNAARAAIAKATGAVS